MTDLTPLLQGTATALSQARDILDQAGIRAELLRKGACNSG